LHGGRSLYRDGDPQTAEAYLIARRLGEVSALEMQAIAAQLRQTLALSVRDFRLV
jgi:hypothetical protein